MSKRRQYNVNNYNFEWLLLCFRITTFYYEDTLLILTASILFILLSEEDN